MVTLIGIMLGGLALTTTRNLSVLPLRFADRLPKKIRSSARRQLTHHLCHIRQHIVNIVAIEAKVRDHARESLLGIDQDAARAKL